MQALFGHFTAAACLGLALLAWGFIIGATLVSMWLEDREQSLSRRLLHASPRRAALERSSGKRPAQLVARSSAR